MRASCSPRPPRFVEQSTLTSSTAKPTFFCRRAEFTYQYAFSPAWEMTVTTATSVELRADGGRMLRGPVVCDPRGGRIGNARRLPMQRIRIRTCTSIVAIISAIFFLCARKCKHTFSSPFLKLAPESSLTIVLTCRFLDVSDFVAETTAINVTALDTLDVLIPRPDELSSSSLNRPWNFWDYIRPGIHKLNVAFRLPLAFYSALEEGEGLVSAASHQMSAVSTRCTTWMRLWPAVCQLQQLRSLHIWLDHDDPSSWSVVKERLALHGVIATLAAHMQARAKGKTMPHMDITFNLPKLHPGIARPDTHFVQESPPLPPFTIERRIRQRCHCKEGAGGDLGVTYEADFFIMYEWQYPEVYGEPGMTLQEVEEFETKLWNEGTDVYQFMSEFNDFEPCFG